ncbi:hypothetical protein [Gemmata palustris]|uniref:hypothetical protein n=1 Tax=Gemmata palustris TaxID=2822762 RepID=UPI001FE5A40E|nr:hypothetical protein [Gemmata palustris]
MTEQEWLTSTDPTQILEFLKGNASDRKLILFAVHHWSDEMAADDEWYQEIDTITEEVIGGREDLSQLIRMFGAFDFEVFNPAPHWWATVVIRRTQAHPSQARALESQSLRCIFGNPFRPAVANPAWFTSTVLALATGIYEDRAFDRLPILADALQDAGCENADILNHCRSDGPHVRGCWVIDLLLGKS